MDFGFWRCAGYRHALFDWTGAKFAPRLGEGDLASKIMRILSYFLFGVGFFLRILPKIAGFKLLIALAVAVWLVFFYPFIDITH